MLCPFHRGGNANTGVDVVVKATLYDAAGAVVQTATSAAVSVPGGATSKPVNLPVTVASGVKKWNIQTPTLYTAYNDFDIFLTRISSARFHKHRCMHAPPHAPRGLFYPDRCFALIGTRSIRGGCPKSGFRAVELLVGGAVVDGINLTF